MGLRNTLLKSVESEAKKAGDDLIAKMQIIDDHVIEQQENMVEFENKYLIPIMKMLYSFDDRLIQLEDKLHNLRLDLISEDVEEGDDYQ